jgi:hypothetical protein
MPGFIKPQLATLKSKAPAGEQWLNEIKYDGYRIQPTLIMERSAPSPATVTTGPSASL